MSCYVDEFYSNNKQLLDHLQTTGEISEFAWTHESFRRFLVIVMANHLENEIRSLLVQFAEENSTSPMVPSFLEKQMEGRYYQYFDWEERKNANKFFGYFGPDFKTKAIAKVNDDEELKNGVQAFLEIGDTRNILVHDRINEAVIDDKTAEEFYKRFQEAESFVRYMRDELVVHEQHLTTAEQDHP